MTPRETTFRAALLDPSLPVPEGLVTPSGRPAERRFSVYRNNVVHSLREALATAFPLLRKLLGAETFARLSDVFVRAHPPASPLMMHYGDALPGFLESFAPLAHIGYLPDCARLDLALRQSYHAADASPVDPAVFATGEEALGRIFALAPSVRILRSVWPVHDIWRFNTQEGAPKPRAAAQDILVARPRFDPEPHLLPPGGAAWFDHLASGLPLGEAAGRVLDTEADFDLTATLSLAISTSSLIDPSPKETS